MSKILKRTGITLGSILGLILIAITVLYFIGTSRVNKSFEVEVTAIEIPTDEATIARGKHYVEAIGLCQECHASNLGGEIAADDPLFGIFVPRNLTSGRGGIGETYNDIDYVRAIRHGIGSDGKALLYMPGQIYNKISDDDLGAIIAYLKSLPPVDNELPDSSMRILGRVLIGVQPNELSANAIDHTAPRPSGPQVGATVGYGKYLATTCTQCHGENLSGGNVAGFEPDAPKAPNLTPGGEPGNWNQEQFITAIRTGTTPTGKILNAEFMPWPYFARMTNDELAAIWLYLESLPVKTFEG